MVILCFDISRFGCSAIKMYKEDLKKVPKKKVLWENMAVFIYFCDHILIMLLKETGYFK